MNDSNFCLKSKLRRYLIFIAVFLALALLVSIPPLFSLSKIKNPDGIQIADTSGIDLAIDETAVIDIQYGDNIRQPEEIELVATPGGIVRFHKNGSKLGTVEYSVEAVSLGSCSVSAKYALDNGDVITTPPIEITIHGD